MKINELIERHRVEVLEATEWLRDKLPAEFHADGSGDGRATGLILGTGLGGLAAEIGNASDFSYSDIPHFPISTAPGHSGTLRAGFLGEKPVLALNGRFHLYEGYSPLDVTFGVRVLARLGIDTLILSNACGGMNRDYEKGDLLVLDDHINLMGVNPLTGPNVEDWGPRFPDMSAPYDADLSARLLAIAERLGIRAHKGVYVAVPGPNLETRAEYRMLQRIGADVVGMSTVPEVIVAAHEGLRVAAISIITDLCLPEALEPVSLEEILQVAAQSEPKLTMMVKCLLAE